MLLAPPPNGLRQAPRKDGEMGPSEGRGHLHGSWSSRVSLGGRRVFRVGRGTMDICIALDADGTVPSSMARQYDVGEQSIVT